MGLVLLVVLCAVTDWTIRLIVINAKLSGRNSYIEIMHQTHVLDLFVVFASHADQPTYNQWNNLILEIIYLLYRGVKPNNLAMDQNEVGCPSIGLIEPSK